MSRKKLEISEKPFKSSAETSDYTDFKKRLNRFFLYLSMHF